MLHCIKEYSIIYYTIINQLLNEPHREPLSMKIHSDNVKTSVAYLALRFIRIF